MRRLALLPLLLIPAVASAQSVLPSVGIKLGYAQSNLPGLAAGVDFKIPTTPIRLDADVWTAFKNFGSGDDGFALTANYVKDFPLVYAGLGVGYANGEFDDDSFNTVAGKVFVGGKVPILGAGVEGALIFTKKTVFTLSFVWRV